ncbi:MAG: tripartite tricarboxylate transporter TctB family protein [Candidatus Binatia bacterium]
MKVNFTFFFLAIFLIAILWGWEWPYIAKLMPVYVAAVPGLILVLLQLLRDATVRGDRQATDAGGIEMDEVYSSKLDKKVETRRTLTFFAWFIGGAVGIWLLGIVIALPLLAFLYIFIEGRERWYTSLIMAGCTYLVIWGLFEYMLESRWPAGAFFQ